MSQFRVEKRRTGAELTLSTGAPIRGSFFLASSAATHTGPERVADLLNAEGGFFPFATDDGEPPDTLLIHRAHVIAVKLLERQDEARLDPGYDLATERQVAMRLSDGSILTGAVRVFRPQGRDRLSDYARSKDTFRYVENDEGTFVVNSAHIVELRETRE